ncbi:hypothetical protein FO615_06200 [Riemerella anatipestifer]|uniref:hypothetical protein n=1 Tax=Riemerella anatipestifer TaxID=34085 RepID=UPI002363A057|nr:hypothetical protein [Riemerella anatipestifer]MDD1553169.1 hypothetical protein [Riemerella anatipestifer]MDD1596140.1 hypothetical protein [Riemerella anatipestifer]MDY3334273.1 hypothetical protein [Riemerella anatipestifer]MDY3380732.1 hypothetical protein [Riemerella anatipestifer]MDY3384587.1 hypothetical protein [Riemerella anatipestifer]
METFGHELAMQLMAMFERTKSDKRYISRILDAKNQILDGGPVFEKDTEIISRWLDDVIKITQICITNSQEFGKFIYMHTNDDVYINSEESLELSAQEIKVKKLLSEAEKLSKK